MSKYLENKLVELIDRQEVLITLQIDIRDKISELVELKKVELKILEGINKDKLTVSRLGIFPN